MTKEQYWEKLSEMVFEKQDEDIVQVTKDYITEGYHPEEAINNGLIPGMNRAGKAFDEEEYFVTDLIICADAMQNALDILKAEMKGESTSSIGAKCVIGVVQGDTHDIGKNLVKIMMETAGFEMIDLGRDVPLEKFIDRALEENAQFICMSTLMTTTMVGMKQVIDMLKQRGLRDRFKVIVGGGPVSLSYANQIGADGYSSNASEAIKRVTSLLRSSDNTR